MNTKFHSVLLLLSAAILFIYCLFMQPDSLRALVSIKTAVFLLGACSGMLISLAVYKSYLEQSLKEADLAREAVDKANDKLRAVYQTSIDNLNAATRKTELELTHALNVQKEQSEELDTRIKMGLAAQKNKKRYSQ